MKAFNAMCQLLALDANAPACRRDAECDLAGEASTTVTGPQAEAVEPEGARP
jgi:hypothetical protein